MRYGDLSDIRFGRLVVLQRSEDLIDKNGNRKKMWKCLCDCGNICTVYQSNLTSGHTKSCGCLHNKCIHTVNIKHNCHKTRIYRVWKSILSRCYNPKDQHYDAYGGRGIKVCDEWKLSFERFRDWSLQNGYDESKNRGECTIDRKDNNGIYSPDNCRIVNMTVQSNNRRSNLLFTVNSETHTLAELARIHGIKYGTLWSRINRGVEIEYALLPVEKEGDEI